MKLPWCRPVQQQILWQTRRHMALLLVLGGLTMPLMPFIAVANAQQATTPENTSTTPASTAAAANPPPSTTPFIANTAAPGSPPAAPPGGQSITTATASTPGVSTGTFVQAFFGLAFLLVLLLVLAWAARKLQGGKGFGEGGMRLLGGIALGPRERIVLVEVGEDLLVIGIVPGQIRTLHRLPRAELPHAGQHNGPAQGLEKTFADWLGQLTHKTSPATPTRENKDNHGNAANQAAN